MQAPPRDEWLGHDGTLKYMTGEFKLPAGSRGVLVRVLDGLVQCAEGGVKYTGNRKAGSGGHNKTITIGSVEVQMVADYIWGCLGFTQTTHLINLHRRESGQEEVEQSAAYSAHSRLEPVVTQNLDSKQGSNDGHSPWAVARLNFVPSQRQARERQAVSMPHCVARWVWLLRVLRSGGE
jgi:hypothetical protein